MRFYIHIDNKTETNTLTCFDKYYDFQVSKKGCKNHSELQDFILFQFVFRNPTPLTAQFYTAALTQKAPMLIYMRDTYAGGLGELDPDETLPGSKDLVDHNLYRANHKIIDAS